MKESCNEHSLILVIDDSMAMVKLLSAVLTGLGHIEYATNGAAGVEMARQRRPQVILLDVEMPGMDGYEVCRQLKADALTEQCSVIFVTASESQASEIKGLEIGAVDFIKKPIHPELVRARVLTHLKMQQQTAQLERLARRDGLTGLYNRRYFDEHLQLECIRHKRHDLPLSLIFIDIDYFKTYNDHYGHQAGDDCLRQVAAAINGSARRPGEVAARYGGEEFVVILPHTAAAEAYKFAIRLCELVEKLQLAHEKSTISDCVTISVGVASAMPGNGQSAQALIAEADQCLYEAKCVGRNCARARVNDALLLDDPV